MGAMDNDMLDPLLQLTDGIAGHLAQLTATESTKQIALASLRQSVQNARRQSFPAPLHTYAALVSRAIESGRHSSVAGIAALFAPVHSSLPWVYHYPLRRDDEDLGSRIAFAELIGPDGPLQAPNCRVGFTVMAEHTTYPLHSHPAIELYLVVSGNAQWQTPTSDAMIPPGDLVLHRSNEPHAMRTFDEPLLALWGWTGNIEAPAIYI